MIVFNGALIVLLRGIMLRVVPDQSVWRSMCLEHIKYRLPERKIEVSTDQVSKAISLLCYIKGASTLEGTGITPPAILSSNSVPADVTSSASGAFIGHL